MDAQGQVERDGGGGHQPAGHGAHGPERVERVDDRLAVAALHPQAVGVLGHVDDRVGGPDGEQRQREQGQRGGEACAEDEEAGQHGAVRRHAGRAVASDEPARAQPGDDRAHRHGSDGEPVDRIAEAERGLDLRVAGHQVGHDGPVGEEHRVDGEARIADLARRGGARRHGDDRTHGFLENSTEALAPARMGVAGREPLALGLIEC